MSMPEGTPQTQDTNHEGLFPVRQGPKRLW